MCNNLLVSLSLFSKIVTPMNTGVFLSIYWSEFMNNSVQLLVKSQQKIC